jgi:hypothetical protein
VINHNDEAASREKIMSSVVIAFPLHRRQRLLNGVIHLLRAKQGDAANSTWREIAKELLSQLAASGVEADAAEDEVRNLLHVALSKIETDATTAIG